MSGGNFYLIDLFRGRLAYPDLRRKVLSLAERYTDPTVLIEKAGLGLPLLQDLRQRRC
jgi:phage terminase large subunit-like protein